MLSRLLANVLFLTLMGLVLIAPANVRADSSQQLFNAPETEGNRHVKAELIFDRESIPLSADKVKIGVLLTIEPGWHIYWKNPGEAGKPTEVKWRMPESWSASPLKWPVPIRMVERGDIMTFAYANQVLLYSELEPPPIVPQGDQKLTFSAEVSWLVCLDRCVPGKTMVEREIVVSSTRAETPSNEKKYFDLAQSRVPHEINMAEFDSKFGGKIFYDKGSLDKEAELHFVIGSVNNTNIYPVRAQFFETSDLYYSGALSQGIVSGKFSLFGPVNPLGEMIAENQGTLVLKVPLIDSTDEANLKGVLAIQYDNKEEKFLEFDMPIHLINSGQIFLPYISGSINFKPADYLFDSYKLHEGSPSDNNQPVAMQRDETGSTSLIFALLSAFLGGIILNLMPCVLPILSIKVMGIVSAKDKSSSENLVDAFWYLLGILITFLLVALVAISLKASGSLLGWGFQFQYPGFVFALIIILFILSLGFFDLYLAELPFLGVLTKVSSNQSMQHSRSKHIVDGVLISTLSTPCTAPFLGTALVFAFSQSALSMVLIFLFIGLGLAFPYILIVSRPSLMKFFPRPGNWMNRIKQLMGFGLLGTIIWLLFVLANIVENSTTPTLMFLLSLYLFFWFWSWSKEASSPKSRVFLMSLAILSPLASLWYAPPLKEEMQQADAIAWAAFSQELVDKATQPVFIDFTADWCITCKYNENFILSRSVIAAEFQNKNVLALKADWTKGDAAITEALSSYGGKGVPHYVYIKPQSPPQVLPTILTEALILEALSERDGVSPHD